MFLKAVSVANPWAWGIVHGPKDLENRQRPTRHRGWLLIHASKSRNRLGDEGDLLPDLPPVAELDFGAIIGICRVTDCQTAEECRGERFAHPDWKYCWRLADRQPLLRPIPWSGKLGMMNVPFETVADALPAAVREDMLRDIITPTS